MKITNDFWRHLLVGVAGAIGTALFGYLTKVDWSSFGPYAAFIQLGIHGLTEILNQWVSQEK
jgi:hypothetical protein